MLRVLIGFVMLAFASSPAFAYDYMKDVLIGNTVEITNQITGETSRYFFRADYTVIRLVPGQKEEVGKWRQTASDLCSAFPSVSKGKEACSDKPKGVTVPSERRFNGNLPDGTAFDILIKWMKGEVPY